MAEETQIEIAKHLDMSGRNLRDLRDREIIPDPRLESATLESIRVAYIRHLRSAKAGWGVEGGSSLVVERSRLAGAQADKLEREAALENGDTIRVDDQLDADAIHDAMVRMRVLALGVRLCQELAAEKEPSRVCEIIDEAVHEALQAIQKEAAA